MKFKSISTVAASTVLLMALLQTPGSFSRDVSVKDIKSKETLRDAVRPEVRNRRAGLRTVNTRARANSHPDVKPLRLPGSNTVLCGAMVYNDLWGAVDANGNYINPITAGMYTIQAKNGGAIKQLNTNQNLIKMRAGTKVGSVYYAISTSNSDTEAYLTTYNTSTWNQASNAEIDVVNVPSDMTYDPVSGNVYGFFYNDQTQEYDRFCRFDTYYGEAEQISTIDRNGFAIAANAKGEIYGIWGYTGWLIKIDSKTGSYEQIGRTGFSPSYINSLAFDDATGKLYWTANDATGYSALLEVDTTTGKATEIMHLPNNASFAGIFAMPYTIPNSAPAAVTDATVTYTAPGALTGNVCYTAPTLTHNGAALTSDITVAVSVNGGVPVEQSGIAPGSRVTSPQLTFAEGPVLVEITTADDANLGESVTITSWAGEDIPGAPADLTLAEVNGLPTLTWTAPAVGKNGGYFDSSSLTYTVVRTTDNATFEGIAATTWTDTSFEGNSSLSYRVYAVNAKGRSEAATSNPLVFGNGYVVPFTEPFANKDAFDLWSVFDLNGNTTWVYDAKEKNIYYEYGKETELEGNDWIISPKIALKAGVTYALTFDAKTYYKSYPENFRFMLGKRCSPQAMTQTIIDLPDFEQPTGQSRRVLFSVDADGVYYLGLYCYSIAHNWRLTVDNIGITEVDNAVPGAVTDLKVTPAAMGALSADIECVAPATDAKGGTLNDPIDVQIFRNDGPAPVHTFTAVHPSAALKWTDNTLTESGVYTYRALTVNEAGQGSSAEVTAFVGVDVPGAVTNLVAREDAGGAVTLSWDAPVTGANGGYFDASQLTYRIQRSNDAKVVAEKLTATSFVDNTLNLQSQQLMYYLVTPYVGDAKGQYNNTPLGGVFGPAYKAPVTETFKGADINLYPWVAESDGQVNTWTIQTSSDNPVATDQNGDAGMAACLSNQTTKGITGSLASPKIDISALTKPTLSFWMYHTKAEGETSPMALTLAVQTDGGEFVTVPDVSWKRDDKEAGWRKYNVDLSAYANSTFVRLKFIATADGIANLLLDNITVDRAVETDIEAVSLAGPARVAANAEATYFLAVSNTGLTDATDVMGTLTLSGANSGSFKINAGDIAAGMMKTVKVPVTFASTGKTTVTASVTTDGDVNADNNQTSAVVTVVDPVIAAPFDLTGNVTADGVTLTWKHPFERGSVSDDFESYKDWAIDNIGDYRMIDRDGAYTYYINMNMEYDNMTSPKAFQVCNAAKLGINVWPEGTPHSGDKMMMSVASATCANDDWMVSPLLNGAAHTVSFYAKAFTAQDTPPEHLRVLYSTSDAPSVAVADFELCSGGDILVPDQWMQYSFVLPEGARRFAINCVSEDAFALFIDDMQYNDMTVTSAAVRHYEVSRNGAVVATVTDPSYIDVDAPVGKSEYRVRAVYTNGHVSAYSDPVTVDIASVDDIAADGTVSVTTSPGTLIVSGFDGMDVSVFTLTGALAARDNGAQATAVYHLAPGTYIVRVASHTFKATVM